MNSAAATPSKTSLKRKASSPQNRRASKRQTAEDTAPSPAHNIARGSGRPKLRGVASKANETVPNDEPADQDHDADLQDATAGSAPELAQTSDHQLSPDLAAVISEIIEHGEQVDNHLAATQGYEDMGVDTESFLPQGSSLHLKTSSLPILDNLVCFLTYKTFEIASYN